MTTSDDVPQADRCKICQEQLPSRSSGHRFRADLRNRWRAYEDSFVVEKDGLCPGCIRREIIGLLHSTEGTITITWSAREEE